MRGINGKTEYCDIATQTITESRPLMEQAFSIVGLLAWVFSKHKLFLM
jgi:hypothetical protein